jgi:hypothetical protein
MQPKVVAVSDLKVGKRLAVTNMDWDSLTAVDVLAIFTSLCKGGDMIVRKVSIYPSLYGIEQMKKDSLYGPPKDLFDDEAAQNAANKKNKNREFTEDDEEVREAFNQGALRRYEINKMKYFYAVVHFDSKRTAERVYNEYNEYEFELSNTRLNLSFIADDLVFPQAPRDEASEVPPDYQFKAGNALNKALNHTRVKLTWDETDPARVRKFQKIMDAANSDDLNESDYKEFLASGTEDEADLEGDQMSKDQIEEYRRKLLGALSSETGSGGATDTFRKRALQDDDGADGKQLDVKFNVGFGEDLGQKLIDKKKEKKQL